MQRNQILDGIKEILEMALDEDNLVVTESSTAKDFEDWDSIANIEIMNEIEKHFNVNFKILEMEKFKNVGDIITKIIEKQN